jgi:hypothetical protein
MGMGIADRIGARPPLVMYVGFSMGRAGICSYGGSEFADGLELRFSVSSVTR